jgi:nucleoside-diphosphate-sugar epimerase
MATTKKTEKKPATKVATKAEPHRSRLRFTGKTAVITGAAQGIGRAVARAMAEEGAHVVLVDRSKIVQEVRDELLAAGHRDAGIYNLSQLGLGLDRLCPRKPVEAFHHQHGPRGYPALFDSDQEDAECPGLDVPLVVGR